MAKRKATGKKEPFKSWSSLAAGRVESVADGIATISGLPELGASELVWFDVLENGGSDIVYGQVFNLLPTSAGVVILGQDSHIAVGTLVYATGESVSIKIANRLGYVVDPLGTVIGENAKFSSPFTVPVEQTAPGVTDRRSVHEPLLTGITAIDALLPIGRGQRELIIGDRQIGKTSIGVDAIINQCQINLTLEDKADHVICIYVAIGQKRSSLAQLLDVLKDKKIEDQVIVVAATASDSAAMQYLAPYSATAIAEFYRDAGRDCLIIYDDLTKHAIAYRQLSLLLRRPPGREAYPGDISYLHSRLLERASKLSDNLGAGSITALPIVETQAGDVSAYIPTNVISITDGQIFLESELFYKGVRPAINAGLSVSRVGSAAQFKSMKALSGSMKLDLAQYREAAAFSQFGADLDTATQSLLARGARLTEILKQKNNNPLNFWEELITIFTATKYPIISMTIDQLNDTIREHLNGAIDSSFVSEMLEDEVDEELIYNLIERNVG